MSHSVNLKPRLPTRGLSLRAARHTTGRLSPATAPSISQTANRVPVLDFGSPIEARPLITMRSTTSTKALELIEIEADIKVLYSFHQNNDVAR